jgi:hypothetical protein
MYVRMCHIQGVAVWHISTRVMRTLFSSYTDRDLSGKPDSTLHDALDGLWRAPLYPSAIRDMLSPQSEGF